jgi:hypothetical protein
MDNSRVILDALVLLFETLVTDLKLTNDEYAYVNRGFPESHVFYPEDFDGYENDSIMLVMERDVQAQIAFYSGRIADLKSAGLREPGGYLDPTETDGCEDYEAERAAERMMGC